jgi:MSHA biogenesis protein MshK
MDESVMRAMRHIAAAACGLTLTATATFAAAASLPDPTQPPAALIAAGNGNDEGMAVQQPVLQSVMISPARRVAIISGQTVALGGLYQGARLVRISETEVVLRSGNETQMLKLFPELEKQPVSAAGAKRLPPQRPRNKLQ